MMSQGQAGSKENNAEIKRLGAQLKAMREAQGLSYDDVTSVTHMRSHVIKSIEDGTVGESMAPVYARSFIKTYCMYLMASDLWEKYSKGIPMTDEPEEANQEEAEERIEITHPRKTYRRSSIIWVYIILIAAILGASYLLWSQHQESEGENGPVFRIGDDGDDSGSGILSLDASEVIVNLPGNIVSPETLPIPEPRSMEAASSRDAPPIASGDLSWMSETSVSVRPLTEIPQFADKTLAIEITGNKTGIKVEQDGKTLTQRGSLSIGARRSYEVSMDTRVTISAGNRARVTWFGKRYDSVGADNTEIALMFHPDGKVTLLKGKSTHFGQSGE